MDVAGCCTWIEGAHCAEQNQAADGQRLLKTNLSLRTVLGEITSVHARAGEFKVICVIRDPLDARYSHYKLMKNVFRAFMPGAPWEYDLEDFANVPLAATDAVKPLSHQISDRAKVICCFWLCRSCSPLLFMALLMGGANTNNAIFGRWKQVDYESYLLEILKCMEARSPNLMVVFYEDFCHTPAEVIAKLSDFTGWGKVSV